MCLPLYNLPALSAGLHYVTGNSHSQLMFYVNGTYITNFSYLKTTNKLMIKPYSQVFLRLANFSCTPTPFNENALRQMPHSRFPIVDSPFNSLCRKYHTQMTNGIYIPNLLNPLYGHYNFKTHISL